MTANLIATKIIGKWPRILLREWEMRPRRIDLLLLTCDMRQFLLKKRWHQVWFFRASIILEGRLTEAEFIVKVLLRLCGGTFWGRWKALSGAMVQSNPPLRWKGLWKRNLVKIAHRIWTLKIYINYTSSTEAWTVSVRRWSRYEKEHDMCLCNRSLKTAVYPYSAYPGKMAWEIVVLRALLWFSDLR